MNSFLHNLRTGWLDPTNRPLRLRSLGGAILTDDERPPTTAARLAVFPLLFVPWLILYEAVVNLGPPPGAFQTYLPGELHWPVWQWAELLYVSPYFLVTLSPFVVTTNRLLSRFTLAGILATVLGHLVFLFLPAIAPPRPFEPHGILGAMMHLDRDLDLNNGTAAFPSFHAFWAFLGASVFVAVRPRWRYLGWAWAIGVSLSCVFTGMHGALDIVAGFVLYLLTWFHRPILLSLNRHAARVRIVPPRALAETTWNVLLVAVMLRLSRLTVAAPLVLVVFAVLWALTRVLHASLRRMTSGHSASPAGGQAVQQYAVAASA